MTTKFSQKALTILLTVILSPVIAAYCIVWAAMTAGGSVVRRILKKDTA